jgi:hypothetical protein
VREIREKLTWKNNGLSPAHSRPLKGAEAEEPNIMLAITLFGELTTLLGESLVIHSIGK